LLHASMLTTFLSTALWALLVIFIHLPGGHPVVGHGPVITPTPASITSSFS
jgi:hypothetical protein